MNGYTKTTWIDNSVPAINAENLNHIEQGLKDVTDEVINGTVHVVDVPYTAENNADSCTTPNTLYYVYVKAYGTTGIQDTKQYLICTPEWYGFKTQYAFTKQGAVIFRTFSDNAWGNFAILATAADVTAAVSGKANSSDVYAKTQADETFVDKTTYNDDLGKIEDQLLQMEDISNKVTQITGNESVAQYPTALAVKTYVDTVIGGIENGTY